MRKRKVFSREFKLEATRMLEEGKKPAADLARELGIRRNQLYKWKEAIDQEGGNAFPGSGRRIAGKTETENARLRRELAQVREENEILKKAAAFFARELK